ncbi:MAG: hypothetical protein FWC92_03900 [Defluviitaleaceae bacterium]|nr:hypothetical protein [Defluviitaleaceae bacterium]
MKCNVGSETIKTQINKIRILVLLGVLAVATAIATFAINGYEEGGIAPTYSYTYIDEVNIYDNNTYGVGPYYGEYNAGPTYAEEHNYVADNDGNNEADEYHTYHDGDDNSHIPNDSYGDYAGYVPYLPYMHRGDVHIEIDDSGNINIDPYIGHASTLDGDYLRFYIGAWLNVEDVSVSLPSGWSYEIGHHVETFDNEDEGSYIPPSYYTVMTFRHTWNSGMAGRGYAGIMPLASGQPPTFTIVTLAAPFGTTEWNAAIGPSGNRVIAVPQNVTITTAVTIPAGRNIIITTTGTNLQGANPAISHALPAPAPVTLSRGPNSGTTTAGRHFIVGDGATLTLNNITLNGGVTDNTPALNRGGVVVGSSTVANITRGTLILGRGATIINCGWSNNSGAGIDVNGGGITQPANVSHLYMHPGSRVANNFTTVGWGGGVHIRQSSRFEMFGGYIEGNHTHRTASPGSGGASNGSTAGVHVGAAERTPSTFIMHGGRIRNNIAHATREGNNGIFRAGGAGVFVHQYCTFHMFGGYIEGNVISGNRVAGSGGEFILNGAGVLLLGRNAEVVSVSNATQFVMEGGTIRNNTVSMASVGVPGVLGGGGVGIYGGTFTMRGGYIEHNTAGEGGGVYISTGGGGGHVVMENGRIRNNRANYGAGVGINPQTEMEQGVWGQTSFTMDGGWIENNRYNPEDGFPAGGGGVFVHGGASVPDLTGNNPARRYPGTFIMNGGYIDGNRATRGGGIFLGGGESGETATFHGGHGAEFTLGSGTYVRNNIATYGGGIYGASSTGSGQSDGGAASLTQLAGSTIEFNRARFGGGVNMNNSEFVMQGGVIRNNRYRYAAPSLVAVEEGGGVRMQGVNAIFTMTSGTIGHINNDLGNRAQRGGGVAVVDNAEFNLGGTAVVNGNVAFATAGQTASGGGVFASTGSTFNLADGHTISNNVARATGTDAVANGGALALDGNIFDMGLGAGIVGNHAEASDGGTANGGGLALLSGDFTLQAGRILNGNTATATDGGTAQGGGVAVLGGNFITEVNISGGTATASGAGATVNGGGAFVSGGTFAMTLDTHITGNTATATGTGATVNGGGLAMDGGTFTLVDTNTITGNTSTAAGGTINGGGAAVMGGTFNMQGGNVYNNSATNGGGIWVSGNDAELFMTGGVIGHATIPAQGNSAFNGGGVWVGNGATFNMDDFTNIGGAITPGTGRIINNFAGGTLQLESGGGVYLSGAGTTFNMRAGYIEENNARRGAGAYVHNEAVFNMESSTSNNYGTITGNHVIGLILEGTNTGGGVYVSGNKSVFNMSAGIVEYGLAGWGGGVVSRHEAEFNMSGDAIVRNNTSTGIGGGVMVFDAGTGTMSGNARIENNISGSTGGGLAVANADAEFIMHNGIIQGNRANNGGGVAVMGGADFAIHNGHIRGNRETAAGAVITAGGGVHVNGNNSVFYMHGGTIGHDINPAQGNQAITGGGVWVGGGARFYMQDYVEYEHNPISDEYEEVIRIPGTGLIARNVAEGIPIIAGENTGGGGVHVNGSTSRFELNAGTIEHNSSTTRNGGGVQAVIGAQFVMGGGAIRRNMVLNNNVVLGGHARGGGVDLNQSATFTMTGGEIYENQANNSGGGIHSNDSSTVNMSGGYIRGNISIPTGSGAGGGIQNNYGSTFIMTGGEIYNNTATSGGGVGIWFNSIGTMSGGYIHGNTGRIRGGGVAVNGSNFTMTGGIIGGVDMQIAGNGDPFNAASNSATYGGGVWVGNGSSFNMQTGTVLVDGNATTTTGTIQGNTATGTSTTWPTIQGGGGAHITGTNTSFNMYAGTVSDNTATSGGGILVIDNANFNLRDTYNKTITRNNATWGGGVWVAWYYGGASPDTSHMTMAAGANNVHITHNTASQRGGGIFTMAAEYGPILQRVTGTNIAYGNLTLNNVTFGNNSAGHPEFSPENALLVMGTSAWAAGTLSWEIHPINNYDINHIGQVFQLPLTGGAGMSLLLALVGAMMLVVGTAVIVVKKKLQVQAHIPKFNPSLAAHKLRNTQANHCR